MVAASVPVWRGGRRVLLVSLVSSALTACATAQLTDTGALGPRAKLRPSDGLLTRTRQHIDKPVVLAARSIHLVATQTTATVADKGLTAPQLQLIANAIDRALCAGLSERFDIVQPGQRADLVVTARITDLTATNVTAAAASKAVGIGGAVVGATTGVPLPIPRLPIGLGSLSVEARAESPPGRQIAAMAWARGADVLTTRARVSAEADAYVLADAFAGDFSRFLVTGADPISEPPQFLVSGQAVREFFGGKPKHAACERFGRNPGVTGTLGGAIGLPPAWTDDGAPSGRK